MPVDDGSAVDPPDGPTTLDELFDESEATEGPADDLRPPEPIAGTWLSTGIEPLDRLLGGGIPPGRMVAFVAPADTQAELFVKQIAAEYDSLYLSTLRPKWAVEEDVRDYIQRVGRLQSKPVATRVEQLDADDPLRAARDQVDRVADRSAVVIDSVDRLETEAAADYVEFLTDLKRRLWDTGSVGLLHCIERSETPPARPVTLQLADLILELRRSVRPGDVEYLLVVAKFRGGRALTEPVKLELTDEIRIDTSRDIA